MTTVKLLNVPFESNYKDTVYFASKQEQESYMNSKVVKTFTDVTYQRKDNKIRVPAHIDTLYNCNYVAYTNTPYTNKTMYAFITDMEYKQDDCTWITIKTDVLQTWMFDYTVKQSFVEREHVIDDAIGKNTIPEQLEGGEFVCTGSAKADALNNLAIVWGVTKKSDGTNIVGGRYQGMYSGVKYYFTPDYDIAGVNDVVTAYDKAGFADAITCMFIAPKDLVDGEVGEDGEQLSGPVKESNEPWKTYIDYLDLFPDGDNFFGGYEPKNNKLKTFPYCYLCVTNNNGSEALYKYEDFLTDRPLFVIKGVLTPGCSIRLIPRSYKGVLENDIEGLNLGKYPICNWTSDAFTNWLTQNSVNIGYSLTAGTLQAVGGIAGAVFGGGLGAIAGGGMGVGGVSSVFNTLGQLYQMSFTPPQSKGNINCGDVIACDDKNNFFFYPMSIKKEYAVVIDEYFTMFGYKVNRVKVPNKNHRAKFWYTKTIDVNIDGAIPNNDLQEIKQCYNTGITFWKKDATMGDYSVNNDPV